MVTAAQSMVDQVVGVVGFVVALFVPGAVATLLTAPVLLSARLRALFASVRPFESPVVTYAVYGLLGSLPYVIGTLAALAGTDVEGPQAGGRMGNAVLDLVVPMTVGYVLSVPVVAAVGLPRLGVDWDPTGYGPGTWLLLAVAAAWYAALFAVPLFLFALVVSFPG